MTRSPAKILVIDDDPDFQEAVATILKSAGHKVMAASNPAEGKTKILSDKPDLVLLDIMMDSLFDGYAFCHAVKATKEFESVKNTPIIFVSAVREIAGSRFGFKGEEQGMAGPDDYIDKPVVPADLLARVEKLLKR
jgi:DNA-binding response OmpR family regulator